MASSDDRVLKVSLPWFPEIILVMGSAHEKRCCISHLWNAKAEKIQDIVNHTKTTVLNQENNIFNPRLLYITARNSIHVQDVVNKCVKMEIYMQE